MTRAAHLRCAIYTRKSSDEGLDQTFNSLEAQREACAAYIASQRHEGWRAVTERFDDGGVSGGTLDRPALARLLAEIEAGRIGMVVVYKIDRLTRSLTDFARLVDRLDRAGCSFVSVTQAFNTSTSMGRLTLNVLLSFAQFEREVTAERIRDKIAASKKKGLWMGGLVPLGYDRHPDPKSQTLVVNPDEAATVQTLFELQARLGSLKEVEATARARGLVSKRPISADGTVSGGARISRGRLHHLLTNPVYIGRVRHKAQTYPGQHPAIVDEALWQDVQNKLLSAASRPRGSRPEGRPAALTGLFTDETGDALTPTHAQKGGRRYRCYVSHRLVAGGKDPSGWRLPAPAFERAVAQVVGRHLRHCADRGEIARTPDPANMFALAERVSGLAGEIETSPPAARSILTDGIVAKDRIQLTLLSSAISDRLGLNADDLHPDLLCIDAPLDLTRRGVETRLQIGNPSAAPDPTLLRALAQAHRWSDALRGGTRLADLARAARVTEAYIRSRSRLAFLAPQIQEAIVAGRQPADLSLARLLRIGVDLDWSVQAKKLGLPVCAGLPSSSRSVP